MMRYRTQVANVLTLMCCVLTIGSVIGQKPDQTAPETTKRFDREKLRTLRERMGNGQSDASKLKRVTWQVGDITREALVYLPPATDNKTNPPLVIAFHGHGGRAEFSARKLAFHEHWPEAICVYPQGLPTAVPVIDPNGKLPGWQKFIGDQNDRDLAFFDTMLKAMKADHHIDENRVYSAGHSNGGCFTYVLWAARGETLAAIAPIAALIDRRDSKNLKPIPIFHVAGETDPLAKFPVQELTMQQDRKLNGCDAEGKPSGKYGTEYTSKAGPPVVTYIHPGGHGIPDDAPKRIAEFFQSQKKK